MNTKQKNIIAIVILIFRHFLPIATQKSTKIDYDTFIHLLWKFLVKKNIRK